ncbi:MAG: hypothetical protein QOH05_3130 [Acetobacteraceae bacterium]|jgi:hypothetical protein|nr:hypothetical protein [Acetobacteraceae bacterium]
MRPSYRPRPHAPVCPGEGARAYPAPTAVTMTGMAPTAVTMTAFDNLHTEAP